MQRSSLIIHLKHWDQSLKPAVLTKSIKIIVHINKKRGNLHLWIFQDKTQESSNRIWPHGNWSLRKTWTLKEIQYFHHNHLKWILKQDLSCKAQVWNSTREWWQKHNQLPHIRMMFFLKDLVAHLALLCYSLKNIMNKHHFYRHRGSYREVVLLLEDLYQGSMRKEANHRKNYWYKLVLKMHTEEKVKTGFQIQMICMTPEKVMMNSS